MYVMHTYVHVSLGVCYVVVRQYYIDQHGYYVPLWNLAKMWMFNDASKTFIFSSLGSLHVCQCVHWLHGPCVLIDLHYHI